MTPSFRGLWIRLRYYLFRERYDREMEEEMRFHLELRAAAHEQDGLSEADARDLARRRFGNTTTLQEQRRMAAGSPSLETLGQDLRDILRAIRHAPGFSVMVVATLGIAIGANAAMFGIIDRLMLRGPAYVVDADRVVRLYSTERFDRTQFTGSVVGFVTYDHLRRSARDFEDLAVYTQTDATAGAGQNASRISLGRASWNFFPLLGVRPVLGRFFTAEEDRPPRGENVVVLDEGYWRRAFGGDREIIGRTMAIGGVTYTILGVAPRGFTGAELERRDAWVPISLPYWGPGDDWPTTWTSSWLQIVGRLKPGVSFAQAGIDATDAHRRAFDGPPDNTMRTATLSVAPLRFTRVGKENVVTRVSRWLVAVATIVLLVACANVANLFLARATRRRREVAVRLALGISRGRLIRLLVGESVVLGLLGGIAGLAVAYAGGKFVRGVLLPNVAWTDAPIDLRVLAVTALMAFAVGLVVGLAPALQGTRLELTSALKSGVREGGAGRSRVRALLTVTQAALSVVLLVGAGLFVMSLWKINALHLGIEPEKLMTVSFDWPSLASLPGDAKNRERLRRNLFYQEGLRRVRALPGVAHAAVGVGTPFQSSASLDHLRVPGRDSIPRLGGEDPTIRAVSDDYFATAGTRVLRGRVFTAADVAGAERVAVVNETMARLVWPKGDAIGSCLLMDSLPCSRVIGVVEDTRKFALKEDPVMQYYIPLGEERELGFGGPQMFVRPAADVAGLREQLRSELTRLDPTISFVTVGMLQDLLDPQIRPWRLGATMFGIFGALALLVAAIGLYSVISYLVAQRAHELGVRIALGAQVGNIVALVMRHGVGMALVGVGIGSVLALNGARWIGPLLFDTSPRNPVIFGVVAVVLLLVALLASVVPAWRASRVDPIEALRAD